VGTPPVQLRSLWTKFLEADWPSRQHALRAFLEAYATKSSQTRPASIPYLCASSSPPFLVSSTDIQPRTLHSPPPHTTTTTPLKVPRYKRACTRAAVVVGERAYTGTGDGQ